MLKNADKYESSSHFTYSEYKKKVKKSPNSDLMIFVSVFIIGLLIILGFARVLSPNVDVGVSVDDEVSSVADDAEDESTSSMAIDERLRKIQMEDEGKVAGDEEMFSPELDEKVVLPTQHKKTVGQMEAEKAIQMDEAKNQGNEVSNGQKPFQAQSSAPIQQEKANHHSVTQTSQASAPVSEQIVNAKVVVGYYATDKQAEVAKSIIQDAGLGVTPIVKNLGGYYTLQVGSYSSREKAQQAANNLLKSNFPARVIVE